MSSTLTGKPQLNRIINRRLILERIRREGSVSRADLAKQTAIRAPTVSSVVRELMDDGFVIETGAGETSRGRAPRMVSLNPGRPVALGFELSETSIRAGLCDLAGALTTTTCVSARPSTPQESVDRLKRLGDEMLDDAGITWDDLVGVGVAIPGHLNLAQGRVRWSRPLGWRDVPLKALCEKAWDKTTDVVNDSLAGGMAGHLFEVRQEVDNLVFLYLRFEDVMLDVVGVGTGIIIHGEPYHGEFGAAGEITTPIVHPLVHASEAGHDCKTVEAFVAAVKAGEAFASEALGRVAKDVARLAIRIANLLEPGVLMLGSDIPVLRDELMAPIEECLTEHRVDYELGRTRLVASNLREYGVVQGAAVPTLQRVFKMPQWN